MAPRRTTFTTGTFKRGSFDTGRQVKNVVTNLKNIFRDLKQNAIKKALIEIGEEIVKETTPLVPVQDGSLRDSWAITVDENSSNPKVTVSYGGPTRTTGRNAPGGFVDYAVIVHEDLSQTHLVGEAKFLEKGSAIASGKIPAIIAKHVKASLK